MRSAWRIRYTRRRLDIQDAAHWYLRTYYRHTGVRRREAGRARRRPSRWVTHIAHCRDVSWHVTRPRSGQNCCDACQTGACTRTKRAHPLDVLVVARRQIDRAGMQQLTRSEAQEARRMARRMTAARLERRAACGSGSRDSTDVFDRHVRNFE